MSKSQKARLGHLNMEYLLTGNMNRPVLFFVHSEGMNLNEFSTQHEYFSDKYCVLSVSLRGHGQTLSKTELSETDFNLSSIAQDLIIFLDYLNISKVHYIGHGIGGVIGFELLKKHDKRLNSIITFGAFAFRKKSAPAQAIRKLIYKTLSVKGISNLRSSRGVSPESKKQIQKLLSASAKSCFINLNTHITNYDYLETIRASQIPAMIIRGALDQKHPKFIRKTISAFQSRGNFLLVHINQAGYFANIDQPLKFNQELEKGLEILSANQVITKKPKPVLT